MKAHGKEKREKLKRKIRPGTLVGYVILVLLVALVIYAMLPTRSPTESPARAAIVDPLFVHSPNQAFIEATGELMQHLLWLFFHNGHSMESVNWIRTAEFLT